MSVFRSQRWRADQGFSLVELLAVVAIMAIMLTLAGMSFNRIGEATSLTTASDLVSADLALAVQDAHARNRPVEFRIYPEATPAAVAIVVPGSAGGNTTYPFRISFLPQNVTMETATDFSSLLRSSGGVSTGTEPSSAPAPIRGNKYFGFKIGADGRTSLAVADEPWTLTFRNRNAKPVNDRPAENFITLLVDPLTGSVRTFQP